MADVTGEIEYWAPDTSVTSAAREIRSSNALFHLLLGHGEERSAFEELVAGPETVHQEGDWQGIALDAMRVTPVEADARLALWSRRSGRLALRVSRIDPSRWAVVVHAAGQRLLAILCQGLYWKNPPEQSMFIPYDPLFDVLGTPGEPSDELREEVGTRRGEQLAAALRSAGIEVEARRLADAFGGKMRRDGNLSAFLQVIGAGSFLPHAATEIAADPLGPRRSLGRSSLRELSGLLALGCLPMLVLLVGVFIGVYLGARSLGLGWVGSALGALLLALVSVQLFGKIRLRRRVTWDTQRWAEPLSSPPKAAEPSPRALDTWGQLFYLVRDVGFLCGKATKPGLLAHYTDQRVFGPPTLLGAVDVLPDERLQQLEQSLHEIRGALLDARLEGRPPDSKAAIAGVRSAIRNAVEAA